VIAAGDALINLAPLKSPLEAEIHVAVRDIGYIRIGDPVTVKLDAYNYMDHGPVNGKVRTISEGAFSSDDNGQASQQPYYKVRVALNPIALRGVPADFRLMPGITLKADIYVGSRSLFTYFFAGILRGSPQEMRGS
jgi:HlyD family secretion protein